MMIRVTLQLGYLSGLHRRRSPSKAADHLFEIRLEVPSPRGGSLELLLTGTFVASDKVLQLIERGD